MAKTNRSSRGAAKALSFKGIPKEYHAGVKLVMGTWIAEGKKANPGEAYLYLLAGQKSMTEAMAAKDRKQQVAARRNLREMAHKNLDQAFDKLASVRDVLEGMERGKLGGYIDTQSMISLVRASLVESAKEIEMAVFDLGVTSVKLDGGYGRFVEQFPQDQA